MGHTFAHIFCAGLTILRPLLPVAPPHQYLAAELAPLLDCGKVWLQGDGFDVGRGSPGDFFTLLVHADEAWFAGRPKGDRLTAGWAALRRRLTVDQPPQGEEEGGCFRFPRE